MRLARVLLAFGFLAPLLAAAPASAQSADCSARFKELMDKRVATIGGIQAIAERNKKKPSIENAKSACSRFGELVAADEAMVSWIESDGAWCGISEQVAGQAKTALENSRKERTSTCKVASSGGAQQAAVNSCNSEFQSLTKRRASTLASLNKLSAAQKKEATPQRVVQACGLLNTLVSREAALNDWVKKNSKRCNIPAKIRNQLASATSGTRKSRTETCGIAEKIKAGGAQAAQAARTAPRGFDPTVGGPGVPTTPGGGVKLPSGAL